MNDQRTQKGASALGLIFTIMIIGYGAYVGMQYIPQYVEFATVESILDNINQAHRNTRFNSSHDVQRAIDMQLNLNVMDDMSDSFNVREFGNSITVRVEYERDLNLLYEQKKMLYEKTLELK